MTDLITKIARATDRNDHWTAAELIAAEYGSEAEQTVLSVYALRHHERGYGRDSEMAVRDGIVKAILWTLPTDTANAISAAL